MATCFSLRLGASTLALAASLCGCVSAPPAPEVTPAASLPANLRHLMPSFEPVQRLDDPRQWWQSWQDPALNALLDEAARNNQDLALAAARIAEAASSVTLAHSARWPVVDANLAASRSKASETTGKLGPGVTPFAKDFQLGLSASYEVDLWGKLNAVEQGAGARLLAQHANRAIVQSSLFASVAQSYFSLRAQDAQVKLAEATLLTREENLRLQQKRHAAGSIGELDVQFAQAELAATEIVLAQNRQSVQILEAALALMLGRSPAEIAQPVIARGLEITGLYGKRVLPDALPSTLLMRRPDILAAEQGILAARADLAQARAQYFPALKLGLGAGYEARNWGDLLNPASLLWNAGASLSQPLFLAGALRAGVEGAQARTQQARVQYLQSVQNAFREWHAALVNVNANLQVGKSGQVRVQALQESLRLASLRYQQGYSSYLEVLGAQRDLLSAQSGVIEAERAHLAALVAVYKAIGGGWDTQLLPGATPWSAGAVQQQ